MADGEDILGFKSRASGLGLAAEGRPPLKSGCRAERCRFRRLCTIRRVGRISRVGAQKLHFTPCGLSGGVHFKHAADAGEEGTDSEQDDDDDLKVAFDLLVPDDQIGHVGI